MREVVDNRDAIYLRFHFGAGAFYTFECLRAAEISSFSKCRKRTPSRQLRLPFRRCTPGQGEIEIEPGNEFSRNTVRKFSRLPISDS